MKNIGSIFKSYMQELINWFQNVLGRYSSLKILHISKWSKKLAIRKINYSFKYSILVLDNILGRLTVCSKIEIIFESRIWTLGLVVLSKIQARKYESNESSI